MKPNLLDAIKEKGNIFGLLLAIALAVILQDWRWLVAGLICEAAYLLWVPGSRWYHALLRERLEWDSEKRRQYLRAQSLPLMRPEMRKRYIRLEEARLRIGAYGRSDPAWPKEMLRNLDCLLETFLAFGAKEQEFRNYMQMLLTENRGSGTASVASHAPISLPSTMPDSWIPQVVSEVRSSYSNTLENLDRAAKQSDNAENQSILAKRIEIVQQRLDDIGKLGQTLTNLSSQLKLIEETFGLVSDEQLIHQQVQVLSDVEGVVTQANIMTKTLDEIGEIDQYSLRQGS